MDILQLFLQIFLLALGFVLLIKGADWFVDGSSSVASRFGIPQLVIGLTIVAMGTSTPEAAVSITAAFSDNADITVGNIVGSNILNILIILGLSSVIVPIAVASSTVKYEMPFMIFVTALLLILGLDGTLGFADGIIMLIFFAVYLIYLFLMAKRDKDNQPEEESTKQISLTKSVLFVIIGLAMIILGSDVTVDAASSIAEMLGMNERFIGLTVVALGTSLPELFTSVSAARKGNADIAIGNIVGSNIFNILFICGISALIIPVPFAQNFIFDMIVAIAAAIMLTVFCIIGKHRLKRSAGILMLASYAVYFAAII
ncbi:MAG: calcium/sodium antiporter [Oscillospiraceae bacterium]